MLYNLIKCQKLTEFDIVFEFEKSLRVDLQESVPL